MKELYMQVHDELVEQYMLDHPNATWDEAYDKTADAAYDRYVDKYADMIDAARDRKKYENN